MWHVWETEELCRGFWWADLRERDHLEDLIADRRIIKKIIFMKWDGEASEDIDWIDRLRVGTGGVRL